MGRPRYSVGCVVLTKANEWQAHWFPYVVDPKTGKEKRRHRTKIVGAKPKMRRFEAEAELRKLIQPIQAANGVDAKPTFGWFLSARWKPLREGKWRKSTKATNDELLGILDARFGSLPLKELDKVVMQQWLNELAAVRSRSTVWHLRIFLKSICSEAVEQDFLAKDPARSLTRPHTKKPDETILEWAEYHAVLAALGTKDRLVAKVAAACALRPEELFAFRWENFIALPNGRRVLLIESTVHRGQVRDFAKSDSSQDYVALPNALALELDAWQKDAEYGKPRDFIFPNTEGGFIHKDNYLNRVLYPVRDRLKLKRLNFQILRRTFATRAYGEHKGTLKDVQKHLRHSKPSVSLEHYIKHIPDSVFDMVELMYHEMIAEPKTVQ